MGHPDGAHTHGHDSGSGAILIVLGAALVIGVAGPVIAALARLLTVVLVVTGVAVGVIAAALAALVVWRLRQDRATSAVPRWRSTRQAPRTQVPKVQRPAIGQAREYHLHLHGVSPGDLAAVLRQHTTPTRSGQ